MTARDGHRDEALSTLASYDDLMSHEKDSYGTRILLRALVESVLAISADDGREMTSEQQGNKRQLDEWAAEKGRKERDRLVAKEQEADSAYGAIAGICSPLMWAVDGRWPALVRQVEEIARRWRSAEDKLKKLDQHGIADLAKQVARDPSTLEDAAKQAFEQQESPADPDGDSDPSEKTDAGESFSGPYPIYVGPVNTMLKLVEGEVPAMPSWDTMVDWEQPTRREVWEWAIAVHARASDNDVEVPPLPEVLKAPESLVFGSLTERLAKRTTPKDERTRLIEHLTAPESHDVTGGWIATITDKSLDELRGWHEALIYMGHECDGFMPDDPEPAQALLPPEEAVEKRRLLFGSVNAARRAGKTSMANKLFDQHVQAETKKNGFAIEYRHPGETRQLLDGTKVVFHEPEHGGNDLAKMRELLEYIAKANGEVWGAYGGGDDPDDENDIVARARVLLGYRVAPHYPGDGTAELVRSEEVGD